MWRRGCSRVLRRDGAGVDQHLNESMVRSDSLQPAGPVQVSTGVACVGHKQVGAHAVGHRQRRAHAVELGVGIRTREDIAVGTLESQAKLIDQKVLILAFPVQKPLDDVENE